MLMLIVLGLLETQCLAQKVLFSPEETRLYTESRSSDPVTALHDLDILVQMNPNRYVGERALFFARNCENDKAITDFNEAVRLRPDRWLLRRATFYGSLNRTDDALNDYQALIDMLSQKPKATDAVQIQLDDMELGKVYWNRGRYFERNHKHQEALTDYQNARKISPSYLPGLADFTEKNNLTDPYLSALNALVSAVPQRYLSRRAAFYDGRKQADLAKADYNRLVDISLKFGTKEGYSPLSWALKLRSEFYQRQGELELSAADKKRSEHYAAEQKRLFGFSAYPSR